MRSKPKLQLFMYMLSVGVLFTMGTDFDTRGNNYTDIHFNSPMNMYSDVQEKQEKQLAALHNVTISPVLKDRIDNTTVAIDTEMSTPMPIAATAEEITTDQYKVTSYYLNVRANKYVSSKILYVVKNGDVLEIEGKADNSWLKLKSGGYVHGKYVQLIKERAEPLVMSEIHSIQTIHTMQTIQSTETSPNKPTTTVKSESKLTEDHIEQIFEGSLLADHGLEQSILEIEQEYGINAYFTIAVMKLESGHGKSKLAKEKNNLFGLNAIDGDAFNKAFSFKTKGESVEKFGQLISKNYVDQGLTSIEKVASKYCQANPKWTALVIKIMERDYKKLAVSLE